MAGSKFDPKRALNEMIKKLEKTLSRVRKYNELVGSQFEVDEEKLTGAITILKGLFTGSLERDVDKIVTDFISETRDLEERMKEDEEDDDDYEDDDEE
jgi:hypothetical protein